MSNRFQLPCPHCGAHHVVSQSQAGETLACHCGQPLPVPTLRELRTLEPAAVDAGAESRSAEWDIRQGLLFVGGVLLIAIGALTTWRILPQRQALTVRPPAFREIEFDVQRLSPVQAWDAWEHFRKQTLDFRVTPEFLENRAQYREMSRYVYAAGGAAALGLVLVVAAVLWPRLRPRATPSP